MQPVCEGRHLAARDRIEPSFQTCSLVTNLAIAHGFHPEVIPALVQAVILTVKEGRDPEISLREYL